MHKVLLFCPIETNFDSLTKFLLLGSHYLAVVNNEREEKEEVYKSRMLQVRNHSHLFDYRETTLRQPKYRD